MKHVLRERKQHTQLELDGIRPPLSIVAMENETGLTREVVRKWEARYGFPKPDRDTNGIRIYPADQVVSLRLIRQLLSAGLRPGKVVGLDFLTLSQMVEKIVSSSSTPIVQDAFTQQVIEALSQHDLIRLPKILKKEFYRQGLSRFLRETLNRLIVVVSESRKRGKIRIFEAHLFTQAVRDILHEVIGTVTDVSGAPRVLLSTPPKESHTLGLLMANAELSLHGACCVCLGAQIPEAEIVDAVRACHIDIVGLTFSAAHPPRVSTEFLCRLRQLLDPTIDIWAGGQGSARLRKVAGVSYLRDLDELNSALHAWNAREPKASSTQPC